MSESKCYGGHALRIAVGITVLVLLLTGGVEAATLVVCPSGCAFSSIQTAINASNNGDTIQVQSGTYHENVNVTKQLTLRGIGNTVVDAGGSGSSIKLSANGITLEGFTATGGGYLPDAGIKVTSNNNMLISNNILNNGRGIDLGYSSNNTLSDNSISNNFWNGIYLESSNSNMLIGNNVSNNNDIGIILWGSNKNNTLNSNNVLNNGHGIDMRYSSDNTLSSNNVLNNDWGISLWDYSSNNTLSNNNVSNNYGSGISLESSNSNMLIGNNVSNNHGNYGNGISLESSNSNMLIGNNVSNNNNYGIYLLSSSNSNIFYNNFFNNINNIYIDMSYVNTWNTTRTSGINIIEGPYIGGNIWAYPNGTGFTYPNGSGFTYPNGSGFSQTCTDADKDGICDAQYTLDSNNIDYLPLTIASQPQDILSYYRSFGSNLNVVETTDLLKAAADWSNNVAPQGFASPITTQQLLGLADEWARS